MAKTAASCTLQPLYFVVGNEIFYEDAKKIGEMLNWAIDKRPIVHASMCSGASGWAGNGELRSLNWLFATSSGYNRRGIFKIVVAPETKQITVGARCTMSTGQVGKVKITVGAAAASVLADFDDTTNDDEHTATVLVSDSGTGEIDVLIDCSHTTGSADDCFIRDFRVEEQPIGATNLPDPADA